MKDGLRRTGQSTFQEQCKLSKKSLHPSTKWPCRACLSGPAWCHSGSPASFGLASPFKRAERAWPAPELASLVVYTLRRSPPSFSLPANQMLLSLMSSNQHPASTVPLIIIQQLLKRSRTKRTGSRCLIVWPVPGPQLAGEWPSG